jgi:transposase-like protein
MEEYLKTLEEFERQFATEAACVQYLYALRWPDGFICPRCGAGKAWFTSRGLCKCAACAYQVSVADASADSLEPVVQQAVVPGSIVRTDGWRGYNRLNTLGYTHDVVRKNADVGDNLLPHCNRVAARLKRWLMGTHQGAVSHDHLDYYLDEYTFRFNRRTSRYRGKLFYRLIQQAVAIDPVPYSDLITHTRGPKPKTQHIGVG